MSESKDGRYYVTPVNLAIHQMRDKNPIAAQQWEQRLRLKGYSQIAFPGDICEIEF